MTIRNKLLIIGVFLCLYPVCRRLDEDNKDTSPLPSAEARSVIDQDSLYRAISACIYFVDDSLASFSKDGYITYHNKGKKYRTYLSRDSFVLDQDRIQVVPEYLETFEPGTDTIMKRSYGRYDLLAAEVSSHCLNTTPHDLYVMLLQYKYALRK